MAFFQGEIFSKQLEMYTKVNIIIPNDVKNADTPVVYLLHGLSDNCGNWVRLTSVERYANRHKVAVIIPEVQRSFYSDMAYGLKYFSYISDELIQFVGDMFGLPTDRSHTYIAGLSMGGFGALKSALTKPMQYAGVASFSAVCDIDDCIEQKMTAAKPNELYAVLGERLVASNENRLDLLAKNCKGKDLSIMMTCGTRDLLYKQNITLRDILTEQGFNVNYLEWDEDHTWEFWDRSIELALEFFFGEAKGGTKTPLCDG